ncbi:MAG TPA: hypothetical protein PLH91_05750 [Tenuifilaceae bacterium]|nr:hypothetical protein [Tenuifilaceae bacterium]HPI44714.1 hypothetical protein [Tenuifilaceae bacterium]HPN21468.1 hypothetical protein [Tenuifilaceae bacterium]
MMTDKAKELKNLYQQKWRENNRQKCNEYQNNWRKNNPEKVKAAQERYWEKKAQELTPESEKSTCIYCSSKFIAKRADAKYCSNACRVKHHRHQNSL